MDIKMKETEMTEEEKKKFIDYTLGSQRAEIVALSEPETDHIYVQIKSKSSLSSLVLLSCIVSRLVQNGLGHKDILNFVNFGLTSNFE